MRTRAQDKRDIWPIDLSRPSKAQVERMYRVAYYTDTSVFRPADVVDFGLDLHRLKECGEVRMRRALPRLRRHVKGLWGRMGRDQRIVFLLGHLAGSADYAERILRELGKLMGDMSGELQALDMLTTNLYGRIPDGLRDRLDKGLGREWATWDERGGKA